MTALEGIYYCSRMIKAVCSSTVHNLVITHLILMFTITLPYHWLCHQIYTKIIKMGVLTCFFQLLHEYPPFWILHNLMKLLHHNDIHHGTQCFSISGPPSLILVSNLWPYEPKISCIWTTFQIKGRKVTTHNISKWRLTSQF